MASHTPLAVLLFLVLLLECLAGKHLRVGYIEGSLYTFTQVDANNKTTVNGATILLLQWVAKRGKFTYDLIKLNYTDKFKGLPSEFKSKNIDWAVGNWGLLHGRNYLAHYLYPNVESEHTAIIPYPTRDANMMSIVKPYRTSVWICFLASGAVMTCLLILFSRIKRMIHKYKYKDSFVSSQGASNYIIGVATNQGATCFSKARSTRLLAGTWCCAALILVNAYSGSLITHMTVPRITPLINSLRDLSNQTEPQILVRDLSFLAELLKSSPLYAPYRENYLQGSKKVYDSHTDGGMDLCLFLVQEGRHVLLLEKELSRTLLNKALKKTRTCQFTEVMDVFELGYAGSIMPLDGSPDLRNQLDVLIMEAIGYGLFSKWQEFYIPGNSHCLNYQTVKHKMNRLSLQEFSGAFVLLGIGIASSFLVLLSEQNIVLFRKWKVAKPDE